MPRPDAAPAHRRVRARPRLPRGPKPSSANPGSRRPQEQSRPIAQPHTAQPPTDQASTSETAVPSAAYDRNSVRTVSVKEAAFRLNKSEDTVRHWLRAGRLCGWQLGGRGCPVLVSEDSVERALLGAAEMNSRLHPVGQR